jgi:hypothetical protein
LSLPLVVKKPLIVDLFLQTPVMLARGISDIGLYKVSYYVSGNIHSSTAAIGIDRMK